MCEYDLRKLAAHRLARLAPGQTLQSTALVHEAWLRMVAAEQRTWENRAHFFATAAQVAAGARGLCAAEACSADRIQARIRP